MQPASLHPIVYTPLSQAIPTRPAAFPPHTRCDRPDNECVRAMPDCPFGVAAAHAPSFFIPIPLLYISNRLEKVKIYSYFFKSI